MKRANTMSTITVELTIKVKTKFTSSNAENTKWIHLTTVLMTTTPFGGGTFTGGHVPEPSDQRTRDFDIFLLNC